MGCLKIIVKTVGIIAMALIVFGLLSQILFSEVLNRNNKVSDLSTEMYNDSQDLLNIINTEFLTYHLAAAVDEQRVNPVLDSIETYSSKYGNSNLKTADQELFDDIGVIVYDYLQVVELDLSYQGKEPNFNERVGVYSGEKRNIYENFLNHRSNLKDKYGFNYEQ